MTNLTALVQLRRVLLILFVAGLLYLLLAGWIYDWSMVEKLLTRLAMPCGLIWGLLVTLALWDSAAGRRRGYALLLVCGLYWVTGTTFVATRFVGLLEGRYQPVDPRTAPEFDLVIVLGGSNYWDEQGHVWLSPFGDRLMLATRLYHQGKIERLVTTGRLYDWYGGKGVDMSDATEQIWSEAGIPVERITKLGGVNTTQEMIELRKYLGDAPPRRVGLLTSAFHMPRAQRLAKKQGLEFTPIPAGFLCFEEPIPLALIPSAFGFQLSELASKEFLAAVLGR